MAAVSTHVLDTSAGRPASGVRVTLESVAGAALGQAITDDDGRVASLGPGWLEPGTYRVRFETGEWFSARGTAAFYPEVVVAFSIEDDHHHHVPLLLSPFGYSTYRGS